MSAPRIGSLCSGYGGLELGAQAAIGGTTAWVSDIDKGACKILAHRFPGVPNIGDMTTVDWSQVEPIDVLTGGTPCQDLSHAGKRKGMTEGTRSNLWVAMREAIAQLRPRLVVWENVAGAYSAEADCELEPCEGCLGDGSDEPHLRALGRVLGDLASLGYMGGWHGLRAADVGAPHGRLRVFVVAYPDGEGRGGIGRLEPVRRDTDGRRGAHRPRATTQPAALLPSPRTSDTNGAGQHGDGGLDLRTAVTMLPTPRATDGTKGGPNQRGSSGDLMLPSAVQLLPTPRVTTGGSIASQRRVRQVLDGEVLETADCRLELTAEVMAHRGPSWGQYAAAIHHWEQITRPAPPPTETGPKGNPRLSAAFSEWMMGLPAGWVTDVPGITRNEALKALGNGVVPQQAEAAVRFLLSITALGGAA